MPALPHNFPTLRRRGNENHRPSVLILGAGMSFGLVPLPGALLAEKRTKAEATLGYTSSVPADPHPPPEHLYQWADDIWNELAARSDPNPKLTLAELLDIPKEEHWRGCVSPRRNTPRHRVVARFAREGLWHQIWSLNSMPLGKADDLEFIISFTGIICNKSWPATDWLPDLARAGSLPSWRSRLPDDGFTNPDENRVGRFII